MIFIFLNYFIVVQLQLSAFSPHPPQPNPPPSPASTLLLGFVHVSFIVVVPGFFFLRFYSLPSVHEYIKKLWYIYMMEYYSAERNKGLLSFATAWMELESIMLSEISQVVKDKYRMISPISGT